MSTEPAQTWDPNQYARNAHFNTDLAGPILALLKPRAGERVLDVGCGNGSLTQKLVDAGCEVVGIDSSAPQVEGAKARGLDCRVLDATQMDFDGDFDAVFSNACLHWIKDAAKVTACVHRALVPGGRFVVEQGGHLCVAAIRTALHAELATRGIDGAAAEPWYFPTPEAHAKVLEGAGFHVAHIELVHRPTPLPTGMRGWLETFSESFMRPLAPADRDAALDAVVARLEPILCADGIWTADYTRLRFVATR